MSVNVLKDWPLEVAALKIFFTKNMSVLPFKLLLPGLQVEGLVMVKRLN